MISKPIIPKRAEPYLAQFPTYGYSTLSGSPHNPNCQYEVGLMARATSPPLVDHTYLLPRESAAEAIAVGTAAWYTWLDDATSFVFRSRNGTFTAYKERR